MEGNGSLRLDPKSNSHGTSTDHRCPAESGAWSLAIERTSGNRVEVTSEDELFAPGKDGDCHRGGASQEFLTVNGGAREFDADGMFDTVSPSSTSSHNAYTETSGSMPTSPEISGEYETDRAGFLADLSNYIALGVVRLDSVHTEHKDLDTWLQRSKALQNLEFMVGKGWIRMDHLDSEIQGLSVTRIYVMPEDVGQHYRRGPLSEFRKYLKALMAFIDPSGPAWEKGFLTGSSLITYSDWGLINESSFHIFNTLNSPAPIPTQVFESNAGRAMTNVLNGQIAGVRQDLYPYQRRSVAMMIQREAAPARNRDPRMQELLGPTRQKFYYDSEKGQLLLHANVYEDARGGILAETMGYGKTLICLAMILATRGTFPDYPEGRLAMEHPPRPKAGTLAEMAAAAAGRSRRASKLHFDRLRHQGYHHDNIIDLLHQSVGQYAEPLFVPRSGNRKKERPTEKTITLCSSTLVIVPPNLWGQWQGEIRKHIELGALDVLPIDQSTKVIPHEDILRKYDIILITKLRFEQEYRDDDLNIGRRRRGEEVFCSPLTKLRWLRVIVDEGHNFAGAGQKTNAMAMLDNMYIERRWVVSGTPSNALVGVEVGMAADEIEDSSESPGQRAKRVLQSRGPVDSVQEEKRNLDKLRHIVLNFLKIRPWANARGDDHAAWNRYVSITTSTGGHRTAPCLRQVLQNLIVRHRIEDMENDLTLPPLFNKVVYLKPTYYDKLSINLFLAVLASNAVTSERVDQDYMFHQKNRKQLETLINNLRQSSFHWVGLKQHDVSEAVRISKLYLEDHNDSVAASDRELLLQAVDVGEKALADSAWNAFSKLHDIGVFIEDFPEHASDTWTLDGRVTQPLLLGTLQARFAQSFVDERLEHVDPTEGLPGAGIKAMSTVRKRAAIEEADAAKTKKESGVLEEPRLKDQSTTARVRANSGNKRKRLAPNPSLDANSPLAATRIVGFSSSKLTYLVSQLVKLSSNEKSIVFYSHNNVAFWLAEALELLGIKFLIYSNTLTVARRATYLATFNQKEEFRVLLMDLKQAAHGLHVAAASRVFIVEPIWQPGIESQAIKRAHRIGQTKPVYVETLVLRDTLEDRMLRRRKQMSNSELHKAEKSLLDDLAMNEMIKQERFIPFTEEEKYAAGRLAPLGPPQQLFGRARNDIDITENPDEGLVLDPTDLALARKKRKAKVGEDSTTDKPNKKRKKIANAHVPQEAASFPFTAPSVAATTSSSSNMSVAFLVSDNAVSSSKSQNTVASSSRNQENGLSVVGSIFGGPV